MCIIEVPDREDREGEWKCIRINYVWKLPKPKEVNRHPVKGSTEGSKQEEREQMHTKTYNNENGKS